MEKQRTFIANKVRTAEDIAGKTAIIYCRVSTNKQDTFHMQETDLRAFAKRYNITILKAYHETGHASTKENETDVDEFLARRPILKSIVQEADSSKWQVFLVFNFDRIARDSYFHESLFRMLYKKGIVPFSPRESLEPIARKVKSHMSEEEIRVMRDKTRKALQDLVQQGYWVHTVPFGYIGKRTNKNPRLGKKLTKLTVKSSEAPIVQRIFKEYASGRSLSSVAEEVHFSVARLHHMLKSITYLGHTSHNGEIEEGYRENLTVKNTHPSLIDEETFNIVQERLKKNKINKNRKTNSFISTLK